MRSPPGGAPGGKSRKKAQKGRIWSRLVIEKKGRVRVEDVSGSGLVARSRRHRVPSDEGPAEPPREGSVGDWIDGGGSEVR